MKKLNIAKVAPLIAAFILALNASTIHASSTDIANSPVITSDTNSTPVPPNIMFIIDDSGSMDWDFLPDWANDYYCKRASGSVKTNGDNDAYSVNSLCCRNRSGSNDACMYGTRYGSTGYTSGGTTVTSSGVRRSDVPLTSSDFNNTYYNPGITYTPPKNANGTSKLSKTCTNSGGTVSGTNCTGGWASVKLDDYGVQEASGTTLDLVTTYPDVQWCSDSGLTNCRKNSNYFYPNQVYKYISGSVGNPFYYAIIPGEYCDSEKLTTCITASAATTTYSFPAKLRWCSDTALTTCQGIKNATYQYPRYPTLMPSTSSTGSVTTEFTVTGNSTATNNKPLTVNSITVATGPAVLSAATASTNNVDTATDRTIANIAGSYVASPKTCSTSGSTRTCTFTVMAPASGTCPSGAITPSLTHGAGTTTMTVTATPQFTSCRTPGSFTRVDIVPSNNSYPYPGLATKATTRTDCTGTTCTYLEEMANFANWFTYYRTRMQMMKSASSLAFSGIGDGYRLGYMTINNNNSSTSIAGTSGDFLNIGVFDTTQKSNWYAKLFSAKPSNGTPLRSALSSAGLLYGGVLTGDSINGSTVTDPVLYSCQKNFAIISTDGYWNTGDDTGCSDRSGAGCKLDTTSAVGNADGVATRPYSDGATATSTAITPTVTTSATTSTRTVDDRSTRIDPTTTITTKTRTNTYTRTRLTSSTSDSCSGATNTRKRLYTGSTTETQTTTTTSNQTYRIDTTTEYFDTNTTTTTATRTVITTNGVVTSDTTVTTTSGPSRVSTITSGPTVTTSALGAPTVTTVGPTTTENPAAPTSVNWATFAQTSDTCIATVAASDTYALTNQSAWNTSTTGPTAGTGTSNRSAGYPITTTGVASPAVVVGPTTGTTTTTTVSVGGISDTLADVAYYYYNTDLRAAGSTNATTGVDVGTGELDSSTGAFSNSFQRMNSYTLGLGIDGYMKFQNDYAAASSGDYYDVAHGTTATASKCTWTTAGVTCAWPAPASDSQANIDDLWHAAVNGHGSYFSAKSPAELSAGLSSALSSITGQSGTAAAATTSNPNITSGDNFLFSSDFTTKEWTSKLERLRINTTTGNIITTTNTSGQVVPVVDWNAQTLLDAHTTANTDSRTIFTFTTDTGQTSFCGTNYASSSKLKPFCWSGSGNDYPADTSLTPTEQSYFTGSGIATLPQLCATGIYAVPGEASSRNCLTTVTLADNSTLDQRTDAAGKKLVNFLRGQTGNEDQSSNLAAYRYYRDRTHALGDIVSSEAVYVKAPLTNFADNAAFATFKTSQGDQTGMVYVAANDGMLHAFNAISGEEAWAFIPTMTMPNMFELASMNYGNSHKFMLDGTPVVDYAYINSAWKTILVGGLAGAGAGYYALDITDPSAPKGLWEFTKKTTSCAATTADAVGQTSDCDLGYSFGNPVITKLVNGTWVVLVTSGYNNTTPGDGKGYLYVLNAETGAIINKIGTGVGSNSAITGVCPTAPCPSGLGKIAAWVDNPDVNNTTKRVYGGDLFGNLWRFDINNNLGADGYDAQLLAILKGPSDALQPITERPELGESNGVALVFVGTGRLLGDSDKSDTTQIGANRQSFYAIKDPLTSAGWGVFRNATSVVQQTLTIDSTNQNRTGTNNSVALATAPGWFVDFPQASERSYTDPALALGTLIFTTNLPTGTACSSSGESFIYNLDFRSGAPIGGTTVGYKLGNALATRPVIVQLEGGAIRSITRLSDTTTDVRDVKIGSASTTARRVSWRQLLED